MTDSQHRPTSGGRRVALSGASGLIGARLVGQLENNGNEVVRLVRTPTEPNGSEALWSVKEGLVDPAKLEGIEAVIHLAGENIAGGRWTEKRKRRIRNSRVQGTTNLCQDLARRTSKPSVLVCASAIGYYGDRGETVLDESSSAGEGYLPEVCAAWEAATAAAADAGIRVVNVRIGVVISTKGGALANMLLPFRMGLGGKVGSGKQYFSWVSHDDVVGAILYALTHDSIRGPVNATSPNPVTNAEFTKTLGGVLHRPTVVPLPAFAARLALGQMADDLLLASARVTPAVLQREGYAFAHPSLRECLEQELSAA